MILCIFKKSDTQGGGGIICNRNRQILSDITDTAIVYVQSAETALGKVAQACFSKANPVGTRKSYREICERIQEFRGDAVYLDSSLFGCFAKEAKQRGLKVITFFHNIEAVYFKKVRKIFIPWIKKSEKNAIRYSDKIILLNKRDKKDFEKTYGKLAEKNINKVSLIPVTFQDKLLPEEKIKYSDLSQKERPTGIFVGSDFIYNVNGVNWFVANVAERLDMDFRIVGRGLGKYRETLERENVQVIDENFDIKKEIMQADFYFNPVFEGSGMKVKTAEALMYGKSVFSTREGWEGYDLDYEKAGGLCESADEFICKLKKAGSLGKLRPFNAYSREIYEKQYSDACAKVAFDTALKQVFQN